MNDFEKKKIIVTDDHHIVRKGIVHMIHESPLDAAVYECANGAETFQELEKGPTDALLLDISLPGESGLEVFKRVRLLYPDLPVLFITMFSNPEYVKLAVKCGASGYVLKDSSVEQIAFAIQEVLEGKRYFGGDLLLNFFDEESIKEEKEEAPDDREGPNIESLSRREREVFMGLAQGRLTKEIAYDLDLSSKTVSTYRNRILEKLNLKNNAEMVSFAIKQNILNDFA